MKNFVSINSIMSRRRSEASLYIRPVPDDCRHDDLRRTFARYGRIVDVTIPVDYYSGRMKGFAFVEYEDVRDAEDAHRAMDRAKFLGRTIDVQFTRGQRKTPSEMQQRDR
ncbi:Arginine/serine-rich splicing factor scl25a transcript I [Cichlidogyrus casuarinus]|uniref:Arginine/serine-rich splicing factor scl25a transcript I n=1 Tax=Cichlidogyrus casuarinus TaxID=1844966 RepID=A0ABD2Q8T7_9PLAT